MPIWIGTSGYSFSDWKGYFYPEDIKSKDMLEFYAKKFNIVEINTSYYGIPKPKTFENMKARVSEEFLFVVKGNKKMTHEIGSDFSEVCDEYLASLEPLKASRQYVGTLLQFPYSFKNNEENRTHLLKLREYLRDDFLFAEFRHSSWIKKPLFDFLHKNNLGYVCVDEPQLSGLVPPVITATNALGYIRLHGRNKKMWWKGSGSERYDYNYSEKELSKWAEKVKILDTNTKGVLVFFNNCHHGQAATNALTFKQMVLEI